MKAGGRAVLGIAVSALLLWWALRDVSFTEVAHELRTADPFLFVVAVALTTAGFLFRAARWGVHLSPLAPGLPFRPRFAGTVIGFAANNLLPARVGEFARAFSLSRFSDVPIAAALGSLVIERLFDAVVLVAFLFLAMASPAFPAASTAGGVNPAHAAGVVALLTALAAGVLFFLVAYPVRAVALVERVAGRILPESLRRPLVDGLRSFLEGVAVLRDGRLFLASLVWAAAQWLFLGLSFLAAFRAFGITEVGFVGALFLQSLIGLAVAVPSSPGFFGPFEAAARVGLVLWGVAPEKAISFAVGFHIGGFVPVTLMGLYYVWRTGLRWREVEESEESVEAEVERDALRT